jgi:general stress protein 26
VRPALLTVTIELPVDISILNHSIQHQDLINDLEAMLPRWFEAIRDTPEHAMLKLTFKRGRYVDPRYLIVRKGSEGGD